MLSDKSSAYLHYKAPQNVLVLMIHLRKKSGRWVIYELEIYIETPCSHHSCQMSHLSSLPALWSHSKSGLEQDFDGQQQRPLVEMEHFASGKEAICLWLVCNSQKMSHQDNPEFLDEVINPAAFSIWEIWADESSRVLFLEYMPSVFTSPKYTVTIIQ